MEQNKQILFSCHNAHGLLTEPKSKADKDAGLLGETAKTLVKDLWLKNTFGYRERIMTDEMYKGLICEQDSMALVQSVLGGEFRKRYNQRIENDYIIGTPDIVLEHEDCIEDVKTSYNLRTFMNAELTPTYYTQGQCYMWLNGKLNYRLIYCLVPTPSEIILNEQKKLYYKFDCNEENKDYQEMCEQLEHNNSLILKLPIEQRVKVFNFDYNEEHIEKLKVQIDKARIFYNSLKL
jgi:hypothetical protein